MKRAVGIALFLSLVLAGGFVFLAFGDTRAIGLPKGTTVEKTGPGQFVFTLPGGCRIAVKGLNLKAGLEGVPEAVISEECGLNDETGRIVALGKQGLVRSGPKPELIKGVPLSQVPLKEYVKIDQYIAWLPARIEFQATRIFSRRTLERLSVPVEEIGDIK
ncbi:MAG: hypothetical protein OEW05_04545 [Candidatus Aminicenantes bacterium]|nr:hypothetical protein [Candidatus Aminicenantes bacterium]